MCTTVRVDTDETAKNIIRLRKEKKISVKQIQETMGFNTPQAIFKWQRGESLPTIDNLVALADLFNVSLNEIISIKR